MATTALAVEHDPDLRELEAFLRRDLGSQLYPVADLDPFFASDTTWWAARRDGELRAFALLLESTSIPVFYAVCPEDDADTRALVARIASELPDEIFLNVGIGLERELFPHYETWTPEGLYTKLWLPSDVAIEDPDPAQPLEPLGPPHERELQTFYDEIGQLPDDPGGRFFEPYMLRMGIPYLGVRAEDGRLVAAGGIHVFSRDKRVAAIGNLATHPCARRKGHARAITQRLCTLLRQQVPHLALNVKQSNTAARALYTDLGFRPALPYLEGQLRRPPTP